MRSTTPARFAGWCTWITHCPDPESARRKYEDLSWHIAFHYQPGLAELVIDADDVRPYLAYFYPYVSPNPPPVSDQAIDEFARTYAQPEKFHGGMELYRTLAQDEQDNLANVDQPLPMPMPVLLLAGNGTGDFYATTVRPLASDVQLVEVPEAGHWLAEEAPAFVTDETWGSWETAIGNEDSVPPRDSHKRLRRPRFGTYHDPCRSRTKKLLNDRWAAGRLPPSIVTLEVDQERQPRQRGQPGVVVHVAGQMVRCVMHDRRQLVVFAYQARLL